MSRLIAGLLAVIVVVAVAAIGWGLDGGRLAAVDGFAGNCNGELEVKDNPEGHPVLWNDGTFNLTANGEFALDGPTPIISVQGTIDELGAIEASGNGTYSSSTTSVLFTGVLSEDLKEPVLLQGTYVVGPEGELPGGEPITYNIDCPVKPPQSPTPDDKLYEIIVLKQDADTLQGLENWRINIYAGIGCTGNSFATGLTDEHGLLTFDNLEAGTYSVEEKPQEGWNPVGPECEDVTIPNGAGLAGLPPCPVDPDLPHPEPGCDEFQSLASVRVIFTNPPLDTLDCDLSGPTQVVRGPLIEIGGRDSIPVEITAMELEGNCVPGPISISLVESPTEDSSGQITEQQNSVPDTLEFKADSYFDVFFEVETPLGILHNQDAIRMECKIQAIPPSGCFYEPDVGVITLYDGEKKEVGELVHARHIPIGPKNELIIFTNERKDTTPTPTGTPPSTGPTPTPTVTATVEPTKTPQPQRTRHSVLRCIRDNPNQKVTGSVTVTEKKADQPDRVVLTATCDSNSNPFVRVSYSISAGATKNILLDAVVDSRTNSCPFGGFAATQRVSVSCTASPEGLMFLDSEFEAGDGDANKNDSVDSIDAAIILQFIAGLTGEWPNTDTNGDGQTNAVDVALILQFTAGLVPALPV